jgi:hypothetical protein
MLGKTTIQWCPICKAWNQSSHAGQERISGATDGGAHGSVAFTYQRHDHLCLRCDSAFSTTSLHHCEPHHKWHVDAAMGVIRRALLAGMGIQPAF